MYTKSFSKRICGLDLKNKYMQQQGQTNSDSTSGGCGTKEIEGAHAGECPLCFIHFLVAIVQSAVLIGLN